MKDYLVEVIDSMQEDTLFEQTFPTREQATMCAKDKSRRVKDGQYCFVYEPLDSGVRVRHEYRFNRRIETIEVCW